LKKLLLLILVGFFFTGSFSQTNQLSKKAEISIITVGPGKELLDTWGHSALRIKDVTLKLDRVYNYGIFDFEAPNFYGNFMKGQLLYSVQAYPFHYFLKGYTRENREIKAQLLELTTYEKQKLYDFVENNIKPENKNYYYDFFYDNCATKLRFITETTLNEKVNFRDSLMQGDYTFRELIYQKLENHPWSKFGIDIALGSIIDKKAGKKHFTFLPSYTFNNFNNAIIKTGNSTKPLIKRTKTLYKHKEEVFEKSFFTPFLLFSILALIVLFITYRDFKNRKQTKILDFSLLFITGLIGVLVTFLWFFTDHKTTENNYNIFWAFLPNLIVAFLIFKNPKFLKNYYLLLLFLLVITIIFWILKIQVYNWALIPILIILATRYLYNYTFLKRQTNSVN